MKEKYSTALKYVSIVEQQLHHVINPFKEYEFVIKDYFQGQIITP